MCLWVTWGKSFNCDFDIHIEHVFFFFFFFCVCVCVCGGGGGGVGGRWGERFVVVVFMGFFVEGVSWKRLTKMCNFLTA